MEQVEEKTKGEVSLMTVTEIKWEPYVGEEIITNITIRKGKKIHERAWYSDKVKAIPRGNAYIIGNGPSRKNFDLNKLKSTGQTYGCNALYRDFIPDYIFSVDTKMTIEMCDNKVFDKCIHYAPSLEVNRKYSKNKLHLIPRNSYSISGNQAIATACVHGHKNLYLIGFDFREYGKNTLNNIYENTKNYGDRNGDDIFEGWLKWFRDYLKKRPYVTFTIVHDNPPEFLHRLETGYSIGNSSIINYKEFNARVLAQPA